MKTFLTTHRIFTCSMTMILLTHTIHAYAPTTTLATGAQVTTLGSAALATNAQAVSVLANQTTQGLVALATSAQAVAIEGDGTGTPIVGGTTITASTNDLSSIARGLANIEGTGFGGTDSLHAMSTNITSIQATLALLVASYGDTSYSDPISRTNVAAANGALTTAVTSSSSATGAVAALLAYNDALYGVNTGGTPSVPTVASALGTVNIATTVATQGATNTATAITAVAAAQTAYNTLAATWTIAEGANDRPSSGYSAAQIQGALTALASALTDLAANQA